MDNNVKNEEILENNVPAEGTVEDKKDEKGGEFRFFKCCSASLKRFSIIMFIVC